VPNGIDLQAFRADRRSGLGLRRQWGVARDERLIGLVARLDPMKDHGTFLAAISAFIDSGCTARFVCVGDGPEDYRRVLQADADRRGLAGHLVWAGSQSDMPGVYNALDLATLTSAFGEGFPNVLGEAMACGVPCVATDVGDAAEIIGDTGMVVPKGDPAALAAAWRQALDRLDKEGDLPGARARERIVARFGVETMIERSEALLQRLLPPKPPR
jgi:glycosyltransferase involved in cell wall biosynthesis